MAITIIFISIVLLLSNISTGSCLSTPFGQTTRNIATQVLQGTGPAAVDLNKYNLPYEQIEKEWTAVFVQKVTETNEKVYLSAKNEKEIFVDTVQVIFPRKASNPGLGIQLSELAGGRDDGLGITIISGIVSGGSADGCEIFPGDSIASVSLIRRKTILTDDKQPKNKEDEDNNDDDTSINNRIEEQQQEWSVQTECLNYDQTVDAIVSLPEIKNGYEDLFSLRIRRLRRRPKINITLQYPPEQNENDQIIEMYAGENLRQGMLVRGVKLNDPLAKRFDTKSGGNCGAGGLCRTCAVSIQNGENYLNPQRIAEKQMLSDQPRWRLACKAIVGYGMQEGNMVVRVNPRQW